MGGRPLCGCLLVAALAFGCTSKTEPVAPTHAASPTPTPTPTPAPLPWQVARLGLVTMRGVASDDSIYVGVAGDGTIYSSPNGTSWNREVNPAGETPLERVRFLGGQFVAVGDGTILTSVDGHAWTTRASLAGLRDVALGNGLYLAVGSSGQVVTSSDAITWQRSASVDASLDGVACGGGLFVAVGGSAVLTSVDGNTWLRQASPLTGLLRVVRAQGQFVAAADGGLMISPDGSAWQRQLASVNVRDVASGGERLVAVGWDTSWTSSDGKSWAAYRQPEYEPGVSWPPQAITSGPTGFLAVGHPGTVFTSPDGRQWTSRTPPASRHLSSVAWDGARFCAGGESGITAWSTDGIQWTNASRRVAEPFWRSWSSIIHANGHFLALSPEPGPLIVATSEDCETWSEHLLPDFPLHDGYGGFTGVASGDGVLVAVGGQGQSGRREPLLATSTDGLEWTARALPESEVVDLQAVTHGAGRFVVLGSLGDSLGSAGAAVFVSDDGVTWTEGLQRIGGQWHAGVVHGNGLYAAAIGELWTSPDGNAWTRREPWRALLATTYGRDRFVAVGGGGRAYRSSDGVSWFSDTPVVPHVLLGVTYAPEIRRFVAVGAAAIVYADY
jgi:hypothetical protein